MNFNVKGLFLGFVISGMFWFVYSISALAIKDETIFVFYEIARIPLFLILLSGFSYYSQMEKSLSESNSPLCGLLGGLSVLPTFLLFTTFVLNLPFQFQLNFFSFPFFISFVLAVLVMVVIVPLTVAYGVFAGLGIGEIFFEERENKKDSYQELTKFFYKVGDLHPTVPN